MICLDLFFSLAVRTSLFKCSLCPFQSRRDLETIEEHLLNFHKDTSMEEYFVCDARKKWLQEEAFEEDLDQLDVWYKDVIQDKEVKEWSSQCQFLCKVKGCGFETKKRLEFEDHSRKVHPEAKAKAIFKGSAGSSGRWVIKFNGDFDVKTTDFACELCQHKTLFDHELIKKHLADTHQVWSITQLSSLFNMYFVSYGVFESRKVIPGGVLLYLYNSLN